MTPAKSFLSPNPVGHAASWSLYDYAAGDPVNGMDPDGRLASPMRSMAEMTRTAAGGLQSYADRTDNPWLGALAAIGAHNLQQASDLLTPSSHVSSLTSAYGANGGGLVGVAAAANVYNPGRSVYNAFTGRELVYGYQLSGEERIQAGLTSLSLAGGVASVALAESSVALNEIELAASIRGTSPAPKPPVLAARGATGEASSALQGARLNEHLRQLEKYGQAGFRELESGRVRYYGNIDPAENPGTMAGRRLVREWDPSTDATRTWHETVDQAGRVRIVRPETGGSKVHRMFDEQGNYIGSF